MRIQVKADGYNIQIPIPTGLIFSKPSVWIYMKLAGIFHGRSQKYMPENVEISQGNFFSDLPEEAVYAICEEIMRIKRTHRHWKLVEVKTADGQEIHITL